MRHLLHFLRLCILTCHSPSASIMWIGYVDNDWHNAKNWFPNKKPSMDLNIFLPKTEFIKRGCHISGMVEMMSFTNEYCLGNSIKHRFGLENLYD